MGTWAKKINLKKIDFLILRATTGTSCSLLYLNIFLSNVSMKRIGGNRPNLILTWKTGFCQIKLVGSGLPIQVVWPSIRNPFAPKETSMRAFHM